MKNHLLLAIVILFSTTIALADCQLSSQGEKIFKSVKLVMCSHDETAYCVHAEKQGGKIIQDQQVLLGCSSSGSCYYRGQSFASHIKIFCHNDMDETGRPKLICDGSRDFFEVLSLDRQTEYAKCGF